MTTKNNLKRKPAAKRKKHGSRNRAAVILSVVLISLMVVRLAASLGRRRRRVTTDTPTTVIDHTQEASGALTAFFGALADGDFAEAVDYYGGSYDLLAAAHPSDARDHSALLADACREDGYQCSAAARVQTVQKLDTEHYRVAVTFDGAQGEPLTLNGQETFEYDVAYSGDHYVVDGLPVQLP